MIYDFSQICKTYDADFYDRDTFLATHCPNCRAIGRFKLYGSYSRYAVYFDDDELIWALIKIKRVLCLSCETTHAVLPGDVIPYKLLSLFVLLSILASFYAENQPVLSIADTLGLSFQFVYSCLKTFLAHAAAIYQHFKETSPAMTPVLPSLPGILALVREPLGFAHGFLKSNRRPCFMCKFHVYGTGPPIGIFAPKSPFLPGNITFE